MIMTPFERAGYTKDSKFRLLRNIHDLGKGDIVWLYQDDGSYYPPLTNGIYVIRPSLHNSYSNLILELIVEDEPVYPNPPHKHKDVIIEWAKGAEIEHYDPRYSPPNIWSSARTPAWRPEVQYRVKPQKSEKETYIKRLEEELLEARAALTKNEFIQYCIRLKKLLESPRQD